jgi:hypothetical protein
MLQLLQKGGFNMGESYKEEQKKKAPGIYRELLCNVSSTCTKLKISRQTFYRWREEDKDFDILCEEAEESLLDLAFTKLIGNVDKGNQRAVEYTLNKLHPKFKEELNINLKHSGTVKEMSDGELDKMIHTLERSHWQDMSKEELDSLIGELQEIRDGDSKG